MNAHKFLRFAAPISVLLLTAACSPEDDNNNNGSLTPTPTITPTATPTGTATPVPTPTPAPITPLRSFRNGNEIWLCLQSQFDGSILNAAVDDLAVGGCTDIKIGTGFTSTIDKPHFHALRLDNDGTGLTCNVNTKRWNIDYQVSVDRCSGCVNEEFVFDMPANDGFGAFCGSGAGPAPIESLTSYFSTTTQLLRVRADVAPYNSVVIANMRIYNKTVNTFITECTSPATISSGGNGLFDAACNPVVTSGTFTPGVIYDAIVAGGADGSEFIGVYNLPFTTSPAP